MQNTCVNSRRVQSDCSPGQETKKRTCSRGQLLEANKQHFAQGHTRAGALCVTPKEPDAVLRAQILPQGRQRTGGGGAAVQLVGQRWLPALPSLYPYDPRGLHATIHTNMSCAAPHIYYIL